MCMSEDSVDQLIRELEGLRVQEQAILRRLVAARARETRNPETRRSHTRDGTQVAGFRIGDRVRITNEVRSPIGRRVNSRDRTGTVTKITRKRVFIQTDNGGSMNRAPTNLQVIEDEAQ